MATSAPTSEPYTDTIILDCNRNNSIEADSGNNENPALFTNKQGKGLKLNAGDKVSVHSAFINEIGNTDGTIEFKGDTIRNSKNEVQTYDLLETTDTYKQPRFLDNLYDKNTDYPWNAGGSLPDSDVNYQFGENVGQNKKQILQPYGYQEVDCANTTKTFDMKDNEMNVQVAYYKCANGENYLHLPRRFDCHSGTAFSPDKAGAGAVTTKQLSARMPSYDNTLPWAFKGMSWSGCPHITMKAETDIGFMDNAGNGQVLMDVRVQSQVLDDWTFQDKGRQTKPEFMVAAMDGVGEGVQARTLNTLGTTQRYRWKNDNSRYMLFKKERTFFTTAPQYSEFLTPIQMGAPVHNNYLWDSTTNDFMGYVKAPDVSDGHTTQARSDKQSENYYWNVRDPACTADWMPYYEIKNIKVEKGFKSPEDVADEVSASLNKTGTPQEIWARTGKRDDTKKPGYQGTLGVGDAVGAIELGASHQLVGLKKDGELFKSFYATNHAHFNSGGANEYFVSSSGSASADWCEKTPGCMRYMSGYHYLGVKRPELWIKGRAFCREAMGVKAEKTKTWGEVPEFRLNLDRPALKALGATGYDVCTNIPWSQRHLLKDWLLAQGEYPELFDYGYSNIKIAPSAYQNDDEVSPETFQMGNQKTGQALARFIHFDLVKYNSTTWEDKNGKTKHDSRRLGCDNYIFSKNTDYDPEIAGVETYSGYDMNAGAVPPVSTYPQPHNKLSGNIPYYDLSSVPLWFWYDDSRALIDGGGQDLDCDDFNLCYGCMKKYNSLHENEGSKSDVDYIAFTTKRIGGIPDFFFKGGNPDYDSLDKDLDHYNYIGVDRHFNAYGTKTMIPYSGYLNGTQPAVETTDETDFYYTGQPGATQLPEGWEPDATKCMMEQTYQYALHTYMGANGISLEYDSDKQKRFNWQGLHTPEYIGNNYNAGADATDPKVDDASTEVYKINKRLSGANYCPEMQPYNTDIKTKSKDANDVEISIATSNWNLEQWSSIFDAHSGIVFANFGGNSNIKKFWHKCLWGILGFSYDQFNFSFNNNKKLGDINIKDRLTFNSRVNPENQNLTPYVLTNALVKSSDVSVYRNNIYGAGFFNDQGLSYGSVWHGGLKQKGKTKVDAKQYNLNNPAISINAASVSVYAERQPTKMLKPYFLIKSNIVGDTKYIGGGNNTDGGQTIPIIGVVNKENGFGDYYFQTDQKTQFTITTDQVISEITTSIHDPDMSNSRVDKNSAVLYLIQKQNNNNLNVISTLMQEGEMNPQDLEPDFMTPEEYNQYFKQFILTPQQEAILHQEYVSDHYQTTGGEPEVPMNEQAIEREEAMENAERSFNPQVAPGQPERIGRLIQRRRDRPRTARSMLGLRAGEEPAFTTGQARYQGAPDPDARYGSGRMTRTRNRQVEAYRGIQERARAGLYRSFVQAGDTERAGMSADMPPWYKQVVQDNPALQTQHSGATSQSEAVSGVSDPVKPTAPAPMPEPQPQAD